MPSSRYSDIDVISPATPTKVLVVASYTPSLVNFRGPLLRSLIERGHAVVATGPERDDATEAVLDEIGVRFRRVALDRTGLSPWRDMRYANALLRLLRCERPGAVLAYTIKPVIYGMLASRIARVPIRAGMIEGIGYAFGGSSRRQRLVGVVAARLYRIGLGASTTVFFLNPDDRQEFLRRNLVEASKTHVIAGTGVDLTHYARSATPRSEAPVFLLIARLLREKGIEVFADAARRVREHDPRARFQVLGPFDPHPDGIRRDQIEAWEAEGLIEYLGVAADVRPILAECSVFVLPSFYREGLPRTALEALATGRPIITTDAPGCREAVRHGDNGWLVPPRDSAALADAMLRFVRDPESIARMGHVSWVLARERFDVRRVNGDILRAMSL